VTIFLNETAALGWGSRCPLVLSSGTSCVSVGPNANSAYYGTCSICTKHPSMANNFVLCFYFRLECSVGLRNLWKENFCFELIERNPPPREGLLFGWFPNKEPRGRGSSSSGLFIWNSFTENQSAVCAYVTLSCEDGQGYAICETKGLIDWETSIETWNKELTALPKKLKNPRLWLKRKGSTATCLRLPLCFTLVSATLVSAHCHCFWNAVWSCWMLVVRHVKNIKQFMKTPRIRDLAPQV